MSTNLINLYSDTQTKPSPEMRQAIANAEVGDEQQEADPTTNRLQEMVADLLGKEAALFLPSGVMCNQIAVKVWTRPGDEIILHETAHIVNFESGGAAALSGTTNRNLTGDRGMFTADQIRDALRPKGRHHPVQSLLAVENTANLGGGAVWPVEQVVSVCEVGHEHGLKTHLDGARLLNAVVASGTSAKEYAAPFDSLWIDLSKGLGCPVGGVLAGSQAFIEDAFRYKHMYGGAMRQSGMIAAAGVYALENNVDRMAEDHENARYLAGLLADIPGVSVPDKNIETNMVYFDVSATGLSAAEVSSRLLTEGVKIGATSETRLRAVTHLDISRDHISATATALRKVCEAAG
jgi:threonine aldolase